MDVRVLGASGGCAPGCPPTSFLVDGRLAVDAGALATVLTLEEQRLVTDVLLTHSHLDHVRELPLMIINGERSASPVRVHSTPETLDAVREHLFNRAMWFEAFSADRPVAAANPLAPGRPADVAGYRATGFPLRHTVPSTGWLLEDGGGAVYFAGDTDEEDCLVPVVAAAGPRLRAVFLETSFPDGMAAFAKRTGHLTPSGLGRAARALPPGVPLYVTHMKPGHEAAIEAEVRALGNPALRPARSGDRIEA